jgi:hypothetical protein
MARCGGGRPTVENSITLDIRHLTRAGLVADASQSGTMQWKGMNNRPSCHVAFRAQLGHETGFLHLISITCFDPFGRPIQLPSQTIRLVATTPPYGGCRWWFGCPHTGQSVMKLHLPPEARAFASRQAHRLGYAVQREGAGEQARRRARKARARIGGRANLLEKLPTKPKWMRWATYWRHMEACYQADQQTLRFLISSTEKMLGRPIGR